MTRIVIILSVLLGAASCGQPSEPVPSVVSRAYSGPILAACIQAGRERTSKDRCSCVQSVANSSLTPSDQHLGASFFSDPHKAQQIRMSDNALHERFWERWKEFGEKAGKVCR